MIFRNRTSRILKRCEAHLFGSASGMAKFFSFVLLLGPQDWSGAVESEATLLEIIFSTKHITRSPLPNAL
jgi:hypothetical protein